LKKCTKAAIVYTKGSRSIVDRSAGRAPKNDEGKSFLLFKAKSFCA